jgi:hypothetical protein
MRRTRLPKPPPCSWARQPAFAVYRPDRYAGVLHASGLLVVTIAGARVSAMTMFTADVQGRFGFPRTLTE